MKIFVTGLEFLAFHGVTAAERTLGCRVRLDVVAEVDETASVTDAIEDTEDYAAVAARAVALCNEAPRHTLEFACARIGNGLLFEFPKMREVAVRLAKQGPALALAVEAVGVEGRFTR